MAVVILGVIFTLTFLNMIVIPALFLKFAKLKRSQQRTTNTTGRGGRGWRLNSLIHQ